MTQNMWSTPDHHAITAAAAALRDEIHFSHGVVPPSERGVLRFLSHSLDDQYRALDSQSELMSARIIAAGWTPSDVHQTAQRHSCLLGAGHLLDVMAAYTSCYPPQVVDPRWQAQLDELDARAWWTTGSSPVQEWAERTTQWTHAVPQLIHVLALATFLPEIQTVLPPPGSVDAAQNRSGGTDGREVDQKMLVRIRALLAKAESTDFPDEAEALSAKAQQLMTQYSIDGALVESKESTTSVPIARRIWLETPYLSAKFTLVSAVAGANNCTAVLIKHWGFATLVGHQTDLNVVELLTTSLLLQATRAMTTSTAPASWGGTGRTRSYRQSFLVAYAYRIGERLRQTATQTQSTADARQSGALLPVLAARTHAVEQRTAELFPRLHHTRVSSTNGDGWHAGRTAADRAQLDVRAAVGQQRRAG